MMREIWGMTPEASTFLCKRRFSDFFFPHSVSKNPIYLQPCEVLKILTIWITSQVQEVPKVTGTQPKTCQEMMMKPALHAHISELDEFDLDSTDSVHEQWHAKVLYKMNIPGIYLRNQPKTRLLPGSEPHQSRSIRWPELQLSWPGP